MKCPSRLALGALLLAATSALLHAAEPTAPKTPPTSPPAPVQRVVVWDLPKLHKTPPTYDTPECPAPGAPGAPGMRAFFYEGLDYKGKPTRVFAYYAAPAGKPPEGGWPAIVCAHGGGGTAYPDWVAKWNSHGYAAISMDLEGHLPDGRAHQAAGPARIDWFGDRDLPDSEQWFYHAVAHVIRANSLLRSFPEINRDKIGLTGISWGGTIASTVAGVDDRFAFAIPVYGCGFLPQAPNLAEWFPPHKMTAAQFADYRAKYDPSIHLPHAKMPILWMNGTNDGTFPMDIFQRSALAAPGTQSLCIRIRFLHGHTPGWSQQEIYQFADSITRAGPALMKFATPTYDPATRIARCKVSGRDVASSSINWVNTQTIANPWKTRYWESMAAQYKDGELIAILPPDARTFFFNARDQDRVLGSSVYVEINPRTP